MIGGENVNLMQFVFILFFVYENIYNKLIIYQIPLLMYMCKCIRCNVIQLMLGVVSQIVVNYQLCPVIDRRWIQILPPPSHTHTHTHTRTHTHTHTQPDVT